MSSTGTGADCTVASPCPCLSAAIGKATAGDTIEVAADGTYKGTCNKDITLDTPATHDITIKGTGGKAVFDFEGNGRAFRFTGGGATVVENFTWKNAAGPQSTESVNADGDTVITLLDGTDSNQGGVIKIAGASPKIKNFDMLDSIVKDAGWGTSAGAFHIVDGFPVLENGLVKNCKNPKGMLGGAGYLSGSDYEKMKATIKNVRFEDNEGFIGGSVLPEGNHESLFEGCTWFKTKGGSGGRSTTAAPPTPRSRTACSTRSRVTRAACTTGTEAAGPSSTTASSRTPLPPTLGASCSPPGPPRRSSTTAPPQT